MRLFAALVPPPEVVADGARTADRMRAALPDVRWVAPARLHLTLAFYGDVADDAVVPRLAAALGAVAAGTAPVELTLGAPGAFPDPVRARVLWLGVGGDRDGLTALAAAAARAGEELGLPPDERPYRPHVTVGYPRRPVDARTAVGTQAGHHGPPWRATTLYLLRTTGAETYEEVTRHPLAPAAGDAADQVHTP